MVKTEGLADFLKVQSIRIERLDSTKINTEKGMHIPKSEKFTAPVFACVFGNLAAKINEIFLEKKKVKGGNRRKKPK